MSVLAKRLLPFALLVACAVAFAPPSFAQMPPDETAGFYIPNPLQVGRFVLEPGDYLVRAVRAEANERLILIMDPGKTTVFAAVLATPHQIAETEIRSTSRLLFEYNEAGKPNLLRSFLVANTSFGYDVITTPKAPATVAGRLGTIYAVTASR